MRVDSEGSIQTRSHDQERLIYKAYSDTNETEPAVLRTDAWSTLFRRRDISSCRPIWIRALTALAKEVVERKAPATLTMKREQLNRYLRELTVTSGPQSQVDPDPLSDFLFRVRAGTANISLPRWR